MKLRTIFTVLSLFWCNYSFAQSPENHVKPYDAYLLTSLDMSDSTNNAVILPNGAKAGFATNLKAIAEAITHDEFKNVIVFGRKCILFDLKAWGTYSADLFPSPMPLCHNTFDEDAAKIQEAIQLIILSFKPQSTETRIDIPFGKCGQLAKWGSINARRIICNIVTDHIPEGFPSPIEKAQMEKNLTHLTINALDLSGTGAALDELEKFVALGEGHFTITTSSPEARLSVSELAKDYARKLRMDLM